jgi:hypothetical protein
MEFRSDLTNLHSVVWNYFTRNEEKTEASCNLCLKDGVEKTVNRDHKGGGCAGYTFNNTKMRRHLENSHGVNLKKVKYSETDENTPNKRVGMKKERQVKHYSYLLLV